MNSKVLALIQALLPVSEEIASLFIHNPASQHSFSVVVSTAEALAPVVAALTAKTAPAAPAAVSEPVIPAGVPSAHQA